MDVPSKNGAAGFTLIEVVVASVLLTMMILAVSTLSVKGAEAQEYAARLNRATEVTQDMVDQMRLELISSVRVFGNDAEGNGNLAIFDLAGAPAPLPGLRLPTISSDASFQPDTAGAEITGNSLFFAKLAWTDRFICASGNDYLVDVYRWVYYYLSAVDTGPAPGSSVGLNLVRVVSEPLIDASGIDRITDSTDQAEVLLHLFGATPDANGLVHAPSEVVWRRGGDPATSGTFRQTRDTDGKLIDNPFGTRPDPWEVLREDPGVRELLSYRHHSVATIYARPNLGVGRYAIATTTASGFPHGFEVQVVGPSSARQIMLHLVVASTNRRGLLAWSNMQVVVDGRDL